MDQQCGASEPASPARAGRDGDIHVLHVDDDPAMLDLTAEYLGRHLDGVRVTTATSVADALDRLEGRPPDCVVSDHDMPNTTGVTFLRRVRERYPHLPFILFTGKGSEAVASDAISAGVTDYLQKGSGQEQYELLANRISNAVDRRRGQRDLERYETIVQAAGDGVFTLDADWRFTEVNDFFVDRTGYARATLLGEPLSTVVVDAADLAIGAGDPPGAASDGVTEEITVRTAEGTVLPMELRLAPLAGRPHRQGGAVGVARDISDRREAESRFTAVFEHMPDPAVVVEYRDGEPIVRAVNAAFEDIFGFPDEEAVGSSLNALIVPDAEDQQATADEVDAAATAGTAVEREVRRETAAGELREFIFRNATVTPASDEIEAHVGVYVDVTERNERRRQLRQEQAFTETLLDSLPDVYYLLDERGDVWRWNDRLNEVTGYTDEEIADMHALEFIPEDDRPAIMEAMARVYDGHVESRETHYLTKDGELLPYELNGAPVRDEDGEIIGLVGTGRALDDAG